MALLQVDFRSQILKRAVLFRLFFQWRISRGRIHKQDFFYYEADTRLCETLCKIQRERSLLRGLWLWIRWGKFYIFTAERTFVIIILHSLREGGGGNGRKPAGRYSDWRSGQHTGPDDDIDRQGRKNDAAVVPAGDGKPCGTEVPDYAGGVQRRKEICWRAWKAVCMPDQYGGDIQDTWYAL